MTIGDRAERPEDCAVAVLADVEIILPLEGLIDREAELARLRKSLTNIEKQLGGIRGKLNNEGFLGRAPADIVEQQRAKETELVAQRAAVESAIGALLG